MLITVELLLADNLRRSLLTIGELDISPLPGLEAVTECYAERFATIPPRDVVQAVSGAALADPQSAGPGFFSVPQPLAEYTGSQALSGKPRSVCPGFTQVRPGSALRRMDKSAGRRRPGEICICVMTGIILSRLLFSSTAGIS